MDLPYSPQKDLSKKQEYGKKYRQEHKEYFALKAREYRLRHRNEILQLSRRHYLEHREEILLARRKNPKLKEYRKIYHQKNKEKCNAYSNYYRRIHLKEDARRSREYRKRHPDRIKNLNQNYYKKNKPVVNQKNRDRYIELKKLTFSKYSQNNTIECAICGENTLNFLTLDHIKGRKKHQHSTMFSAAKLWYYLKKNDFPPGYQILCWNCNVIKYRKNVGASSKNPKAVWTRQKRLNTKMEVFSHYSKGKICCACCGFNDINPLGIDHKDGRKIYGHSKTLTSYRLHNELKKKNFPSGFQILCYNCNGAKSDNGICPHTFC